MTDGDGEITFKHTRIFLVSSIYKFLISSQLTVVTIFKFFQSPNELYISPLLSKGLLYKSATQRCPIYILRLVHKKYFSNYTGMNAGASGNFSPACCSPPAIQIVMISPDLQLPLLLTDSSPLVTRLIKR
jgi:hypothetical protein